MASSASRPNILWISLEDTSPRLGCYGDPVARTPNFDRLAAEGRRYPNTFCTAPVCAPSRFSVIMGIYAISAGAHHMRTNHRNRDTPEMIAPYEVVPPHYAKALPEYLRAAGYFCTNNAKTDYQFAPTATMWDECGREAHWRHRAPGQPFFAVFNCDMTHESGMWPRDDEQVKTDPAALTLPPYLPDTPKVRLALARHYDNIARDDDRAGELLGQLAEDGEYENTIVFVWSDHGEGLPRGKRWPYDHGTRVPMIVRMPGEKSPGTVDERLVSLIDLAPSVLSLCAQPIPAHLQGQPFIGPEACPRSVAFASRDRYDEAYDMVRAARDGRYRYVRNCRPELPYLIWVPYRNRHPAMQELYRLHLEGALNEPQSLLMADRRPIEELYDTQADPWNIHNIAHDPAHAPALARLRDAVDQWRHEVGDLGDEPETEMVERFWPGHKQPVTAAPILLAHDADHWAQEAINAGTLKSPAMIQLHSSTQGASIAWAVGEEEPAHWRLYTGPIRLDRGATMIRAKAVRYGYASSAVTMGKFEVE